MKTLALYFEQDTTVEIAFDETIIKMYQAQKAIEDRILNADDPEEESAKIEAEAEAMLAEAEALKNSLDNIALIMADKCENRMTLDDLEKLEKLYSVNLEDILKLNSSNINIWNNY